MLITLSALLEKSWTLYKNNWRALVPYMVFLFIPTLLLSALGIIGVYLNASVPASTVATNIIILVVFVASLVFSFWATMTLIAALGSLERGSAPGGWAASFSATAPNIWPLIYTSILAGLIILGGTLLLIIPGVIFAVWYAFVSYAVVLDNKRGRAALAESKRLVVGRWGAVLWRLLAPGVVFIMASAVLRFAITVPLALVVKNEVAMAALDNLVTALTSALITPLASLAVLILYRNAQATPVSATTPPAPPANA